VTVQLPAWHPHLDVWAILGGVWLAYIVAVRRRAAAAPHERTDVRRRATFFTLGMLTLWFAADWPMHDLAERYLYSVHMVQHMLFSLVAAPLLVVGLPAWMLRSILRPRPVRAVFAFFTRPLVALVFFNGVLLFTHWPEVVNASIGSEPLHLSLHVLIVASSVVMWWPVLSPLPEMPPLAPPGQILYLFLQSLAPTIPASFLTFGRTVLYAPYAGFPRIWGISAITDQLVAGLIMKLVGGAILWGFIAAIFFRWAGREQREGWDALRWRGVEREVRARALRR
jgi:putative membrane protein